MGPRIPEIKKSMTWRPFALPVCITTFHLLVSVMAVRVELYCPGWLCPGWGWLPPPEWLCSLGLGMGTPRCPDRCNPWAGLQQRQRRLAQEAGVGGPSRSWPRSWWCPGLCGAVAEAWSPPWWNLRRQAWSAAAGMTQGSAQTLVMRDLFGQGPRGGVDLLGWGWELCYWQWGENERQSELSCRQGQLLDCEVCQWLRPSLNPPGQGMGCQRQEEARLTSVPHHI